MFQSYYQFDVLMNVDSNELASDISIHDNGKKILHMRIVTDMGAFDINSARFHAH